MNRDFSQRAPLQGQAEMLASKGRYGDTMLVHMNPREVDVLAQMVPGNQLTINPDTGQPEAFLPLVLGLAGALAGGAATTGVLGTLGAVGAGALGTGLGTTIETGSLKEGLKAGLISGVLGGVAGNLMSGLSGATAGTAGTAGTAAGTTTGTAASGAGSEALKNLTTELAQKGAQNITPPIGTSVLAQGGSEASQQIAQNLTSSLAPEAAGGTLGSILTNPDVLTSASIGGTAGLTGQAMTDQFNMMNMGSGEMMDDEGEDFYVPVQVRDRGAQFAGADYSGSGEFDYFANPFGFDQVQDPSFNAVPPVSFSEGGRIEDGIRRFDMGGGIAPPRISDFYRNVQYPVPDYFNNPFGGAGQQPVNQVADGTRTEQVYTPRDEMMPNVSMDNVRGASEVGVTDYNRRLLGSPTRTVTQYRDMTADEIAERDGQASYTTNTSNQASAFHPDILRAALNQSVNPQVIADQMNAAYEAEMGSYLGEGSAGAQLFYNTGYDGAARARQPAMNQNYAQPALRTNATPTADTPSHVGMMGNTIDPYQKMLDRQAPAFDPTMPAMDFGYPSTANNIGSSPLFGGTGIGGMSIGI